MSQQITTTLPLPQMPPTAPAPGAPAMNITVRRKLPTGIARNVLQHVVFLLDESTSMAGDKIDQVSFGMIDCLAQMGLPTNKGAFRVSISAFSHEVRPIASALPVEQLPSLNLVSSGGTDFDKPIDFALHEIAAVKATPEDDKHYLRPAVFMLSDGQASVDGAKVTALKEVADVITCAYGADADAATLARISSDGKVQIVGTDGTAMREFLAEVGQTLVSTLTAAA